MSVKVMGLVWDADLPRNQKMVLLAYADHADHDGRNVYPTVGRVAWKTGYSERAVQSITRELENIGIIEQTGTGPVGQNKFRIVIENLPKRDDYRGGEISAPPEKIAPGGVQKTAKGGEISAPKPSLNRPLQENPDLSLVVHAYENNIGIVASNHLSEKIQDAVDTYPTQWIIEAINIAVDSNVRRWNYVEGVLRNWRTEGRGDKRGESKAASAWGEVKQAVSNGARPEFSSDRILEAVRPIWPELKTLNQYNERKLKVEFERRYNAIS